MVRPRFDPSREFVASRGFTLHGVDLAKGDPIIKPDPRRLRMIYDARMIDFAPEGTTGGLNMTGRPGGWYDITAPWLDEPVSVRGKVPAERELARMVEAGEPAYHHGVTLTEGENGWYEVQTDWEEEPHKVHGEPGARQLAAKLRDDGPPPDPRTEVTVEPGLVMGEAEGEFVVNAPWLEQAEIITNERDAQVRAEQLRSEGPPKGWEPRDAE